MEWVQDYFLNMKNVIKLNNDVSVDLPKLIEGGMVILANSGGGKSYLIRRIAEQAVKNVQVIILDPEGEFASLREKYDFILAGKDADVPAEPRSAALLATKLLQINKSAIIDLYELHPQERQRYVKLFCDALVNAPKELYHPVIIILDEAHEYVPEGKPSEATYAVESLASKGRKRGQRLILASQRISKLSKNAAAECNNKLIGRASQDIDMKRAGDELGFTKERLKDLRQLRPGEFFAFGPAISDEVVKVKIGEVETAHAKVSYGMAKVPPPTDIIKKVLAELKDLPQEAEKEAKTVQELKAENTQLKRKLTDALKVDHTETIKNLGIEYMQKLNKINHELQKKDENYFALNEEYLKQVNNWFKIIKGIGDAMKLITESKTFFKNLKSNKPTVSNPSYARNDLTISRIGFTQPIKRIGKVKYPDGSIHNHRIIEKEGRLEADFNDEVKDFGKCARAIYTYLHSVSTEVRTKTQIAVAVGYSQNSGGFNNALSELSSAGLITRGAIKCADTSRNDLLIEVDTSLQKWVSKLPLCTSKIWHFLLNHDDLSGDSGGISKEMIAEQTGYSSGSGGFNNSISELSSLGLIERMPNAVIRINPEILNL